MTPKLRRKLTLAKIEQHEPVTDYELVQAGLDAPNRKAAGWWCDPFTYTWRWMPPSFMRQLTGVKQ